MGKTVGVLLNNGDSKYKVETYYVVVLKTSDYTELVDIKGKELGYFENSIGSKAANSKLLDEISVELKSYKASDKLVQDLLNYVAPQL